MNNFDSSCFAVNRLPVDSDLHCWIATSHHMVAQMLDLMVSGFVAEYRNTRRIDIS